MTDKKLTNNEIIKVLECCSKPVSENCKECPLHLTDCLEVNIEKLTLDLITYLQAENKRLNAENMLTISERNAFRTSFYDVLKQLKTAKSEAVKECLAKVKNYIKAHCNPYGKPDFDYDTSIKILNFIDKLAKEMVSDDNDK